MSARTKEEYNELVLKRIKNFFDNTDIMIMEIRLERKSKGFDSVFLEMDSKEFFSDLE